GVLGGAPGQTAIGRGAHLHPVSVRVVVPLRVAMAVVRACRGVVARDPGLVEVAASGDGDRRLPVDAASRRPADEDRSTGDRGRTPESKRDREPGVVSDVVRDGRVADPRIRPALVDGGPRKEATGPRGSGITGACEANVRGASVVEATDLE